MKGNFLGAVGLVAGTCIGAVTVALPVSMAQIGFLGCVLLFVSCWFVMAWTGLLVLRVNNKLGEHASFLSMAQYSIGKKMSGVVFFAYGGLLYVLIAAYLTGGGDILLAAAPNFFHNNFYASLAFFAVGYLVLFLGRDFLGFINKALMLFLVISFFAMLFIVIPEVDFVRLNSFHLGKIGNAWLVMLAAFGYQVIVPSVRQHCGNDYKQIKYAIILGSIVPLFIYLLWTMAVMGVIPLEGAKGLLSLQNSAHPAKNLPLWMAKGVFVDYMRMGIEMFVFLAIATSFFGISISLYDFVKDCMIKCSGCKIFSKFMHSVAVLLVMLPPSLYACFWPGGFVTALEYAGGFVLFLNIILPIWMFLKTR